MPAAVRRLAGSNISMVPMLCALAREQAVVDVRAIAPQLDGVLLIAEWGPPAANAT